jgi:hypothetical protein
MAQIPQGNVQAVLLNQPVDPILPRAATLGAAEAKHVQLLGPINEIATVVG